MKSRPVLRTASLERSKFLEFSTSEPNKGSVKERKCLLRHGVIEKVVCSESLIAQKNLDVETIDTTLLYFNSKAPMISWKVKFPVDIALSLS